MSLCKNGHPLSFTNDSSGYMMGKFSCDLCHNSHDCSEGRWACVPCQYDVCITCIPPPPPPVPLTAYVQCGKCHPLAWSTDSSGYMMGKFSCDICKKSNDAAAGRWTCKDCQYDICPTCRPPEEPEVPPVPMTALIQCNAMHPLEWTIDTNGYMAGVYSCDACKKSNKAGVGRWSCLTCKYDICQACRPPIEEKCPKGHNIELTFDGSGYMMNKYSCDKCHNSYDCSGGRFSCPCKYDICPVCKSK